MAADYANIQAPPVVVEPEPVYVPPYSPTTPIVPPTPTAPMILEPEPVYVPPPEETTPPPDITLVEQTGTIKKTPSDSFLTQDISATQGTGTFPRVTFETKPEDKLKILASESSLEVPSETSGEREVHAASSAYVRDCMGNITDVVNPDGMIVDPAILSKGGRYMKVRCIQDERDFLLKELDDMLPIGVTADEKEEIVDRFKDILPDY
ncbi:MAG: hypothetical protein LUO93_07695, partial [Methanomicrobiales archaeon]|nr:hypothetical protein [Methanomicrobiales archaeon]